MDKPLPILEPLTNSLINMNFGEFLKSRDFKRYLIKNNLSNFWREIYDHVEKERNVIDVSLDHEMQDSINSFNHLLNDLYISRSYNFFGFIESLLKTFYAWNKHIFSTDEIIEDLELLNCPNEILEQVKKLDNLSQNAVPKSDIPTIIDDYEKLEKSINKMDITIKHEEFNLTLTYAYSSLEGIFKAYISNNIPSEKDQNELAKMSKIVKEHLKTHFHENDKIFPEQMINLIGTMTNAISNARNNFSDSHFDKESDRWLAEFTRDCVNSIGRLILNFVK